MKYRISFVGDSYPTTLAQMQHIIGLENIEKTLIDDYERNKFTTIFMKALWKAPVKCMLISKNNNHLVYMFYY